MMRPIADIQPTADTVDAELAKKVQLFLSANRRGFRRVSVWAEGETVRLAGPVDSFYLRQMAAALAKRVAGVRHVVDDLEVDQEEIGSQRRTGL
jgi:osmotically-inducible protein OsmY